MTESSSTEPSNSEFIDDFSHLGHQLTETDINDWMESDLHDQDYEHLVGIIEDVLRQSDDVVEEQIDLDSDVEDEPEEAVNYISHKTIMEMLDKCITWLYCQSKTTPYNTGVLLSFKEIAAKKRFSSLKQATMTSYFCNDK